MQMLGNQQITKRTTVPQAMMTRLLRRRSVALLEILKQHPIQTYSDGYTVNLTNVHIPVLTVYKTDIIKGRKC